MSTTRRIEIDCHSGDGTSATAAAPDKAEYVILRTSYGKPVHVNMEDGRALAGWLLEHCVEDPDASK